MQIKHINLPRFFQPYSCTDLIRLGRNNDGGYIVNKSDVVKTKTLLGFGILDDYSFEEDFVNIANCKCKTYDASSNKFKINENHKHYQKFVTEYSVNGTVALSEIMNKNPIGTFIKCDIEGGEYQLLDTIINVSENLTGFVVEFHDVDYTANLFAIMNFISKFELKLVHTHINNCSGVAVMDNYHIPQVLELSFTSSKNIALDRGLTSPHALDMPNESTNDDYSVTYI